MTGQSLPPGAITPAKLMAQVQAHPAPPVAPPPVEPALMPELAEAMVQGDWLTRADAIRREKAAHGAKAGPWLSAEQRRRVRRQLDRERQQP